MALLKAGWWPGDSLPPSVAHLKTHNPCPLHCCNSCQKKKSKELIYLHRVRTGPGNPGKSWNFIIAFSRTGKSWKSNAGPGKSWKSVKLNKVIKFSLKQMSKVFLVFL